MTVVANRLQAGSRSCLRSEPLQDHSVPHQAACGRSAWPACSPVMCKPLLPPTAILAAHSRTMEGFADCNHKL